MFIEIIIHISTIRHRGLHVPRRGGGAHPGPLQVPHRGRAVSGAGPGGGRAQGRTEKNICAVQKISVPRQLGAVPVSSSRYQSKRPRLLQEEDEPSVETVDQVSCDWSRGAMPATILISDWSRRTEARCLGPEVRRAATSLRTTAAWWVWCAPGAASSAGASQSYRSASADL